MKRIRIEQVRRYDDRTDAKVMTFVALFNGLVSIFYAFLDDGSYLISVNSVCYLSRLHKTFNPRLRDAATRSSLWWMQDGVSPHCTNAAIGFLNAKFHGRVISRRTANPWPSHNPDLNPVDFHFWDAARNQIFK